MLVWLPLIATVTVWIALSVIVGIRSTRRVRRHPELGPVGTDRPYWQSSLRPLGNVDRPISEDSGGESF